MMKCVLVLALLHLCVSAKSDHNLITEISHGLSKLRRNFDFKSNSNVTVKGPNGATTTPRNCLGVVIKELENLLLKVTVQERYKPNILGLQKNLDILKRDKNHTKTTGCLTKSEHISNKTFLHYKNFFKKLNTKV